MLYDWESWARPEQLPLSGSWYIWLLLSGRGYGKTRALLELLRLWAYQGYSPIGLIGQSKADVRDNLFEIGESSLTKICPPWFFPIYEPSKRRLTFPNGSQVVVFSGDEPDQLRGWNLQKAIVDEVAKFQYPDELYANLILALRSGDNPQAVIGTTPRPIQLLKSLVQDTNNVVVTRGSTMDNKANLAPEFIAYIKGRYEGTRLGRQEIAGEILESIAGLVYDAFTPEQCIIPRFAVPLAWNRYFAIDFGRVNTAALWYAQEPSTGFLYLYRTYKQKASVIDHVRNFQALSKGEVFRRKVGGNHQEQEARDGYSIAGWHVAEPSLSNSRVERMRRVNTLHAQNRVYIFSDLSEYIDEKLSFSYTVNQDDSLTDRIHNESAFHFMSAEGYLLSEFRPEVERKDDNKIRVIVR